MVCGLSASTGFGIATTIAPTTTNDATTRPIVEFIIEDSCVPIIKFYNKNSHIKMENITEKIIPGK